MKRPLNDLYSDFFKEVPKKEKKENATEHLQQLMQDIKTLDQEMEQIITVQNASPKKETIYPNLIPLILPEVLGQEEALKKMDLALKRSSYQDHHSNILNTILLCGPLGSGRHLLLDTFHQALYTHQLLNQAKPIYLKMGQYHDEMTWIQDLYRALQQERTMIVFEEIEQASPTILSQLTTLFKNGVLPLKQRYLLQNKHLINADKILNDTLFDHLSAKKQYFICLSSLPLKEVTQKLGHLFLETIHDYIETKPLTLQTSLEILQKDLAIFTNQIQEHFQTTIQFEKSALMHIATWSQQEGGYHQIKEGLIELSHELNDYFIQNNIQKSGIITYQNNTLQVNQYPLLQNQDPLQEVASIQREIDQIVGLKEVKQYIYALKNMIQINQRRQAAGLKSAPMTLHTIFTGNPGTGKTTMARLMASYLKALGILKNGQLLEVTRADLVAQYVGQTAPKTKQVIEASLGGVLFIDEAYALYRGKEDSFGLEAIDMLVKSMEDYRNQFVVVLAGYTKEMQTFLEANSGLKSRFPNQIEFPDYSGEELLQIACQIAKAKDYEIELQAQEKLLNYFTKIQNQQDKQSGNGRLARNIVEDAILKQATRLVKHPESALTQLLSEDFQL